MRSMTVVCAGGQVNGGDREPSECQSGCCTASPVTRCLEDFMPLTWLPRMDETWGEHANEPP